MRRSAWVLALLVLVGCAGRAGPSRVEPGVEQQVLDATRPDTSTLIVFRWSLQEGQSRFSGLGAARVAPEYRARLDLFGPQDVPYLSAILRNDALRVSSGVPARIVPPGPLMWSALGVVLPPEGARLRGAVADASGATIAYESDDGDWIYRTRDGALREAEWRSGNRRYTVQLTGGGAGQAPQRAVYRDWQEYRELVLELEEQEDVDAFPPDTWILDAR